MSGSINRSKYDGADCCVIYAMCCDNCRYCINGICVSNEYKLRIIKDINNEYCNNFSAALENVANEQRSVKL